MIPHPLPMREVITRLHKGFGRSAKVRLLYAERCSLEEIAAALEISIEEVRRTLLRIVAPRHYAGKL